MVCTLSSLKHRLEFWMSRSPTEDLLKNLNFIKEKIHFRDLDSLRFKIGFQYKIITHFKSQGSVLESWIKIPSDLIQSLQPRLSTIILHFVVILRAFTFILCSTLWIYVLNKMKYIWCRYFVLFKLKLHSSLKEFSRILGTFSDFQLKIPEKNQNLKKTQK